MSLALFTYCLPILLGYILFVGISGRLNPVSRPSRLVERPSWALGLWVASSTIGVLMACLHLAYISTPSQAQARALLQPSAFALGALLLPGLALWLFYRGAIARKIENDSLVERSALQERFLIEHLPELDDEFDVDDELVVASVERAHGEPDEVLEGPPEEAPSAFANPDDSTLVAAFLDVAGPQRLEFPDVQVATVDTDDPVDATALSSIDATAAAAQLIDRDAPITLDVVSRDEHEISLGDAEDQINALSMALTIEQANREETEKHLRITRKGLARLELDTRVQQGNKADALIALEEELETYIRDGAILEARATRESALRQEAEALVVSLKEELLKARRKVRRGMKARARALSAATRAVALTRRAVKARARMEKRLRDTEKALANREVTLSSVIRELDQEKGRTREEVGALARQMVLHEKQLSARRAMEEVARSVEGKLTSRLARKIARARPIETIN